MEQQPDVSEERSRSTWPSVKPLKKIGIRGVMASSVQPSNYTDYLPPTEKWVSWEDIIKNYYGMGFTQKEILEFLKVRHGISISLRQLQRKLQILGLNRGRNGQSDMEEVIWAMGQELADGKNMLGYRAMHQRITTIYHLKISRHTIRGLLKAMDHEGVELRTKGSITRRDYSVPGPNFLWHIDGWDKLKKYGLAIHGCIDGFSRRVMWLKVACTNNDPYVICKYFVDCVKERRGIPQIIRADRGTENGKVELMQTILRLDHDDQLARLGSTFIYGKSTHNQRIECWWGQFKKLGMLHWIDHFKRLSDIGIIDPSNDLHIQCVRYCYIGFLQDELDTTLRLWNTHYIRKNRNMLSPHGKPDVMYHLPHVHGASDYIKPVDDQLMGYLSEVLTSANTPVCEKNAAELFSNYRLEVNKPCPTNMDEADELLVYLLDKIEYDLWH